MAVQQQIFGEAVSRLCKAQSVGVLPVHSCLTADLLRRYLTLDGQWIDCIPKD